MNKERETAEKIAREVQEQGGSWTVEQELEHRERLRERGAFINNSHRAVKQA